MNAMTMDYIKTFVGILVIVNPIGMAPVFLTLTEGQSNESKRAIARLAVTVMSGVLIGSSLAGQHVLKFFGVGIPAFRAAGGILLLLTAISMLQARQPRTRHTPEEEEEAASKQSIAIVPLAIPLLAGPGAISTTILYGTQADTWIDFVVLIASCALVGAITYITMRLSRHIGRVLGKTGINIVTRLFGILLAALGVEFITAGLAQLLPGLAGR